MSNDLIQFNFEADLQELENQFPCSNIESIYINDNNNGNYSNGKVNFTSASIMGSTTDKHSLWSQAQLIIPYQVQLDAGAGCFFTGSDAATTNSTAASAISQENSLAVGTKGYHNFVDNFTCKFNGVPINRNTNYVNLLMNEKLKKMGGDEKILFGDILNYELDNENSLNFDSTIGEINNILKPAVYENSKLCSPDLKLGLTNQIFTNQAHLKRMSNTNYNPFSPLSNYQTIYGSDTATALSALNNSMSPCMTVNTPSRLTFKGIAVIPLSSLHDCFKNIPSLSSSTNFELNLQLNISTSNSWTLTYTAASDTTSLTGPIWKDSSATAPIATALENGTGGIHTLKSISSIQSVGNTCPYIVSQAGCGAGTGLSVRPTIAVNDAGTDFSIKLTSTIGWGQGTQPCRIYLPTTQLNPSYTKMILSQPSYKLLYNDYYQDTILNCLGGATISKSFNVNISRPRSLYIIPFLSNQNVIDGGFMTSPFLSPISSAPTTCSPCSLTNFQVQIGGQSVFSEPIQYNFNFYNDHVMSLIGKYNGNATKSNQFSGQITKSMWEKAYGVYMVNLEKVSDQTQDDISKSFQVSFRVNTVATVKYDFIILLEYQIAKFINRTSGILSDSQN